jgi:hypothetical protein
LVASLTFLTKAPTAYTGKSAARSGPRCWFTYSLTSLKPDRRAPFGPLAPLVRLGYDQEHVAPSQIAFAAVRSIARVFGRHLVPHVLVYEMTKFNWPPNAARCAAYCATPRSTSSLTSRSYGTRNREDATRGVLNGRAFDEGRMRTKALREAEEKGVCSPRVMEKVELKVSRRGFLGMLGAAVVGVSCGSIQSGETSI